MRLRSIFFTLAMLPLAAPAAAQEVTTHPAVILKNVPFEITVAGGTETSLWYEVRTSTEVKRTLSMTLEEGETRYVRLNISMGFFVGHVYPELVENDVGEKEIEGLHYLGGS